MTVSLAGKNDIADIVRLETECMPHPWDRSSIEALTEDPLKFALIAREGDVAEGYIGISFVADEAEVGNVCTAVSARRKGVAASLFMKTFEMLREKGVTVLFLEVSEKNDPALALYGKLGFEQYNLRKGYYGDEDALLLRKFL